MLLCLGWVSFGLEYVYVCIVSTKRGLTHAVLFRLGVFWSGICLCLYCLLETDERMSKVNQTYLIFFLPVWEPSPVCCVLVCLSWQQVRLSINIATGSSSTFIFLCFWLSVSLSSHPQLTLSLSMYYPWSVCIWLLICLPACVSVLSDLACLPACLSV